MTDSLKHNPKNARIDCFTPTHRRRKRKQKRFDMDNGRETVMVALINQKGALWRFREAHAGFLSFNAQGQMVTGLMAFTVSSTPRKLKTTTNPRLNNERKIMKCQTKVQSASFLWTQRRGLRQWQACWVRRRHISRSSKNF